MSDSPLIDPWAEVPTGRKLEEDGPVRPKNWFGSVDGLPYADEDRIALARRYFVESSDDDFKHDGKVWIAKGSKERYRIVGFDPLLALDPSDMGVERFVVRANDALIFLRREGATSSTTKRVELGTVEAVRVS